MKPRVNNQGKAVVERCQECDACQEWMLTPTQAPSCKRLLVMLPDGQIREARGPKTAEKDIRAWIAKNSQDDAMNLCTIEWRHGVHPSGWKVTAKVCAEGDES